MPAYFDTSAIVPVLIDERSSAQCRSQWESADVVLSSALAYVEVHAALAAAHRQGRLDDLGYRRARTNFEALVPDIALVPATTAIVRSAADLASRLALRGYGAVHCATALAVASDDLIAVSGDRQLLHAWSALGVATVNTTRAAR